MKNHQCHDILHAGIALLEENSQLTIRSYCLLQKNSRTNNHASKFLQVNMPWSNHKAEQHRDWPVAHTFGLKPIVICFSRYMHYTTEYTN
jgi:hypothetical protein